MLVNELHLTKTHPVPGIVFRQLQGEADYPAIAEVITASYAADGIEEVVGVDEVANDYAHPVNFDPKADVILAGDANGRVVGLNRVNWRINDAGERLYWQFGHVLPEWRRKGIGRAMLDYTEERARVHAQARPLSGPSYLQGVGEDTAHGKIALFQSAGYTPARFFFLMQRRSLRDLPDAPMPPGIEFLSAAADHLRAIWDAKEEAFRDHWGYASKTEADYQQWTGNPENDLGLWVIAWDAAANQIAGVSLNMIREEDNRRYNFLRGWVNTLGVRRPWRGRGLARALLVHSLRLLRERGMTEVVLGVDSENLTGALKLYESVGFCVLNKDVLYRKVLG